MATMQTSTNGALATREPMFLPNFWYAAGWSSEITSRPIARRILGRPIALFRTESGKAAAFDDCCPHRMASLSLGAVEGETLRCSQSNAIKWRKSIVSGGQLHAPVSRLD